ncbi:replication endonuclease [Campylobacter fetus]|uniref:Replication endonuclease n=2 Tax=Campylobacter fetus TaxID=196 RepID=A0A5L8JQ16_CAMFE|nr:replication endonuclease [Campylobacter fetus]EAI4415146.1 replication endonuclease [Campylobacter fetus]EAI5407667.1 replication endonuclease [Campylobacter fetus]EAJ0328335.1 replication endonuclease [Campylobacter fetus]EAJ1230674.1 replication endonuclease [Campylobacter fetus]EAK0416132.1 replication endonuclease [Campylobacter fetus]
MPFGISKNDLIFSNLKLQKQKDWLKKQIYKIDEKTGEIKTLLDCSMSANLSPKYYAELNNRVNTIQDFSFNKGLKSSFLTITLNGCFRDALNGDFSRFKPKDRSLLSYDFKYKIMFSPYSIGIKDLIDLLNYQWNIFVKRIHTKFKGLEKYYIRAFEPHKSDGVPHIHALLSYPEYAHEYIYKTFKDIFYAPQNLKVNYLTKEQIKNGEINGFQWTLSNPTGYVLKYINKSFINFDKNDKLDPNSAWYIKYKVRKFLSSRHHIPLWIYRKINFFFKDFYNLCTLRDNPDWICEWSYKEQYFRLENIETSETIFFENGVIKHTIKGHIIHFYEKEIKKQNPTPYKIFDNPIIRTKKEYKFINLKNLPVSRMKDYTLITYYKNLDTFNANLQHLAYVENLLIKRGLSFIVGTKKLHNLNNLFDDDFIERNKRKYDF